MAGTAHRATHATSFAEVVGPPRPLRSQAGATVLVALALFAAVWFGGLGHRSLIKADEGRYAEIPREMTVTGDWLTPRLNGLKYFEKPPLQYWTTAVAYELFGVSEWTSRLWTALTGFAGVLVVGWTAARLYDRRTGVFAATVLASCLAWVLLGHFNTLDMGLAFFVTVTWCAVLLARAAKAGDLQSDAHCGAGPRRLGASRGWMLVAWAAMALATLSKGPIAVVLSGGALIGYLLATRDWTLLRMLAPVRGFALFVLIAGPWFIAVSRANPEFARFFFVHEHVERFLTTEHHREGPPWYFVPVLLAGLLPWVSIAAVAVVRAAKVAARDRFSPERLMLALVVVVFAFFSLSGSKLPSYILPLFPPLAVLVARALVAIDRIALRRHLLFVPVVAGIAAVVVVFVPLDANDSDEAIAAFRVEAAASLLAWLAGSLVALMLAARGRPTGAVLATGIAALAGWSCLLFAHETLGRGMSTVDLARRMAPAIAADTPIYSVGLFEHTLDFYLRRTVTPVAFRDELDFGLTQQPDRGIATLPAFRARWMADRAPLAIMAEDVFDTLAAADFPMRVIARDRRRVVVGKPPADVDADASGSADGSAADRAPARPGLPIQPSSSTTAP